LHTGNYDPSSIGDTFDQEVNYLNSVKYSTPFEILIQQHRAITVQNQSMWVFSHISNDGVVVYQAYFSSTDKNLPHAGMAYTILETQTNERNAQRDANTARPPVRPPAANTPRGRTDYNTLRRT